MSTDYRLRVQGSAAEPYDLVVTDLGDDRWHISCSCPAEIVCKHLVAVVFGECDKLVDCDSDFDRLRARLVGTSLRQQVLDMKAAEMEVAEAQKRVKHCKAELTQLFYNT